MTRSVRNGASGSRARLQAGRSPAGAERRSRTFPSSLLVVVSSADNRYHGTFDNNTAAALVESNPQKFQYVPTSGSLKGTDY